MDNINIVKNHYNADVQYEWKRLEKRHPIEFEITKRYLERYIKPGDRVLDIGGGPGRYSLYLAGKGCDVTLFDLSEGNIEFAAAKAAEAGLMLNTVCGDACIADQLVDRQFDHILMMGPIYHLLDEGDRVRAMNAAISLLRPGGIIFISFISLYAGFSYYMKNDPSLILDKNEIDYIKCYLENKPYCGDGFTKVYFCLPKDILSFMEQFPFEKLHLFGQEGICSPCENNIMACSKEVIDRWIDISYDVCEREEFLSFPEHLMYVGRKSYADT